MEKLAVTSCDRLSEGNDGPPLRSITFAIRPLIPGERFPVRILAHGQEFHSGATHLPAVNHEQRTETRFNRKAIRGRVA